MNEAGLADYNEGVISVFACLEVIRRWSLYHFMDNNLHGFSDSDPDTLFYADPDPGSQKCPYVPDPKVVNTKEEKLHQKMFN